MFYNNKQNKGLKMYLKIGDKAPDFTLKNYDGKNISLSDLNNASILLWFFPKANTPG